MGSIYGLSNLRKIRWGWLLILIVFFAAIFGISTLFGDNVRSACLWAIAVNGIAACGGIAPIIYARLFKPDVPAHYLLSVSVIRLLLAVTGSSIILLFVKIDVFWFAAWVTVLYLAVLVLEVCFFTKILTGRDKVDKT